MYKMVTTRKIIKNRIELPKVRSAQNTKVNSHIKNKKSQNERNPKMISDRTLKRTLKSSEKNNVQNMTKISSYTKATSESTESTESRKRKREDRISDKENTDCLHLSDLSKEHISQCISVINHLTEEQLKNNNALFDDESQSIFMQITCIRVPKTPRRCIRM